MIFWNVKMLQNKLGIGRDTAYALMHSSSFPAIKIGGKYYVEEEAVKEWLQKNRYKEVVL